MHAFFDLNEAQLEQIKELDFAVMKDFRAGRPGMIVGQINTYPNGSAAMRCKYFCQEDAKKISEFFKTLETPRLKDQEAQKAAEKVGWRG